MAYHFEHTTLKARRAAPWFQSSDQCWVCAFRALSLSVLYSVRCLERITFQIEQWILTWC